MSFRRWWAITRKEFLHIVRDPRSLYMALAIPLLLLLLFGYALSLDVDQVPTAVYDLDRSSASRDLIEQFRGSRYFRIVADVATPADMNRSIDRGTALVGVLINPGFGDDLKAGREAKVQLVLDGSDSNTASIALGYATSLVALYGAQLRVEGQERLGAPKAKGIDARIRVIFNSDLKSRNYIVPGLIAVILMIIAAVLTSLCVAREWENGTMEQLLSTPLRPVEFLLGKLAAYFAIGMVDMVISILTGVFLFDVPLRGSAVLLIVSSGIFCFGALCWGIMLSTVTRQQVVAYQVSMLSSFLPAFLLSGFIYSIDTMPRVIQIISHIFPARYFVTILKGIFLKGVGVQILWQEMMALAIYSIVVFVFAVRKMRAKVA
ncbi:ABC transporter permease [Bryobacter aggregatus]|uniref:ABC transporter permease n=1 Tax=Bryobacter aggregatus TaxID=360054 RepID=UPI0004E12A6E|nr:ABC transporter permease [Bryobacter aggregatus]